MSVESVKNKALSVIEEASGVNSRYNFENFDKKAADIKNIVKDFRVNAPLIGLFSAGKSSILNKYLNIELPVGIEAKTSVACEFVYDSENYLEVIDKNSQSSRKSAEELKDLNIQNCSFVRMHLNSDKLIDMKDITIVDMPGLDSGYQEHNEAIKNYITSASYFIIIMDIENGTIKKSLLDFLKELNLYKLNFGFLISKYEQKDESDIDKIIGNIKTTILSNIGEDIFVGKVSVFNSDIADFEKILSNMQVVDIAKNSLYPNLKRIIEELLNQLNRKLKYDRFNAEEINKNIRELENKEKDIEKSIEKEAYFIKNKANNEVVNAILSDISNTLSENVDMLVAKAKENSSSLENVINSLIRPVIVSSADRHLGELLKDVYGRIQMDFNSIVGDLQIASVRFGNLEDGNKLIDVGVDSVMAIATKYLPTAGITAAGTLGAVAAASAAVTFSAVALPIVGALILAAIPLFGKLIKSHREASQNEQIKSQILGNIIPSILNQIKSQLEASVCEQTEAFIKAIREKFEAEKNNIEEALNKVKSDKENSEAEYKEKQELLKQDIDKIEKLIDSLN